MSFVGNFGKGEGQCKAVFALGTLSYFSVGEKFKAADFSTADNPVTLGSMSMEANIEDLVKAGNYAYIIAGQKMYIVNALNPTALSMESNIEFSGYGEGLATKSTNVYVAAGDGGLRIIDASNVSAPVEIAAVDTIGYAEGVSISGDYAYVAVGSSVRIINISDPSSPVYSGEITGASDWFQSVTVRGSFAYICDYGFGLKIVNISDPANPVIVSEYASGSKAARVQLDGDFAYIAHGDSIKIADVSDPANPVAKGSLAVEDRAVSVWVGAGSLFVADRNYGLKCVNISNPSVPVLTSSIDVVPSATGTAYGLFYDNNKVYIAYGSEGLRVVNVQNPSAPVLEGEIAFEGDSREVVVKGNYAYVAARDGAVKVVDVSNANAPVLLTTIETPRARGIKIGGNYVYVAASDSGMAVIDVTDPSAPDWVASASAHYGEGVAVNGNVAAVTDWSNIKLYDVTDPVNPVLKGETGSLTSGTSSMTIAGSYLYVPDYDTLKVYDISDLNSPNMVYGVYCGASWDGAIVVEGDYGYISAEENGVRVFDLSDPLHANEVAYYKGVSSARALAVNEGYVYVAEKTDGMSVYKNELITSSVEDESDVVPTAYELQQNYPNPFNPTTKIHFTLPEASKMKLAVYNLLGEEVVRLIDAQMSAGNHEIEFNAGKLTSGVYFYRLETSDFVSVKKMMLIK